MADPLIVERDGRVVTLINSDPPYNPINLDFMDSLEEQVDALDLDASVGAVVLRSAGDDHFSVGMNLKETDEGIARKGSTEGVLDQALRIITKIETMDKPWIATLYGYCLGGGLEFPLGCHFRLAAEEGARIGLPEFHIGSLPALGGAAKLTRCVGRANALDMILRVKMISGPGGISHRTRTIRVSKRRAAAARAGPREGARNAPTQGDGFGSSLRGRGGRNHCLGGHPDRAP